MAIVDLLGAGRYRAAIAYDFDIPVEAVTVLDRLYDDFAERQRGIDMESREDYS
jgi:hypothetical protein